MCFMVNNAAIAPANHALEGSSPMYEYRILFPRLGSQQIRRELTGDPRLEADRRRSTGAYRPERSTRRERA